MISVELGKRYFLKMRPLNYVHLLGIKYTCSNDREKWVECVVIPNRHKYCSSKITLLSIEDGYGGEEFYQTDFDSLVKEGHIIEKTSREQHVEEIEIGRDLLGPNMYVVHTGYVVVGGD